MARTRYCTNQTLSKQIFQNITLDDDTIPQIEILSYFLLFFFRFNYQLLWEQQDQNAFIPFPQVKTEVQLLPYFINETNKHPHYRKPTSLNDSCLELINLDNQFLIKNSEVSDSRPHTTTNITSQTLSHQNDSDSLQQDSQQDIFYSDDSLDQLQNQEEQFPNIQDTQQNMTLPPHLPDPSDIPPIQNVSKISDITTNNPQSITITTDSNIVQIPIQKITQNTLPNQNHTNNESNHLLLYQPEILK